jgi:sugar phosphate isomerase/epimerase
MLKYAFMSFSCQDLSLGEMLSVAKQYGYVGIEPRMEAEHAHGIEMDISVDKRNEIKQQVQDSGISLCCLATSRRYAIPETFDQQAGGLRSPDRIEDTYRCIDLAGDLGVPNLRIFGGRFPKDMSREEAIELVADGLRSVADYAQQRGVTLCMETHDDWTDPAHVVEVMKRVDHPAIAVNWDIMHPVIFANRTVDEAFEALAPWIKYVHFHDGVMTDGELFMSPMGEGVIDMRRAVELLESASYDGFLSGEWINWEPYEIHLPRELQRVKAYEQGRS